MVGPRKRGTVAVFAVVLMGATALVMREGRALARFAGVDIESGGTSIVAPMVAAIAVGQRHAMVAQAPSRPGYA